MNNTPRDIAQNITTFFNVWYEALSGWFSYNQLYKYIEILLIETDAPSVTFNKKGSTKKQTP